MDLGLDMYMSDVEDSDASDSDAADSDAADSDAAWELLISEPKTRVHGNPLSSSIPMHPVSSSRDQQPPARSGRHLNQSIHVKSTVRVQYFFRSAGQASVVNLSIRESTRAWLKPGVLRGAR
eukprot:COSAG01_NODE_5638_length_4125_cov_33.364382_2_plen_122_part_00